MNNMTRVIIIGGGISGLYVALKLSQTYEVILLDDRKYIGGRVRTNENPQYEIGAGRFGENHAMVNILVERYGLAKVALPSKIRYLDAQRRQYIDGSVQHFKSCMNQAVRKAKAYSKKSYKA